MSNTSPKVTIAICTRNRGQRIVATIKSTLSCDYDNFELLVIDQSVADETEDAIAPFLNDPRLRYLRSATKGVGHSRQIALENAHGDYVLFTDDDCVVPSNWIGTFTNIFEAHDQVAVAYCNVDPAPYDESAGFIPTYQRDNEYIARHVRSRVRARGIGAGMAVRKDVALSYGGFDKNLGPGSMFRDCEDGDIAIRALLNGWWVYETNQVAVVHDGFRTWQEGKDLAKRNWTGIGAAYAKPIKCGHWRFLPVVAYEAFGVALFKPLTELMQGHKPHGFKCFVYFCQGFFKGLKTPVNTQKIVYTCETV